MSEARIGLSNLHYAKMTTEDTKTSLPVYGTPVAVTDDAIQANVSVNYAEAELYSGNVQVEQAREFQNATLTLEVPGLTAQQEADLTGATVDAQTGLVTHSADDVAPWVAIMFEGQAQSGTKRRLVKLFKCRFSTPSDENQTKGSSTEYRTTTLEGTCVALKYTDAVTGKGHNWKQTQTIDADDETDWYDSVLPDDEEEVHTPANQGEQGSQGSGTTTP